MGRNNDDFWHGTNRLFNVGDHITPQPHPARPGDPAGQFAWVTTHAQRTGVVHGQFVYKVEPLNDDVEMGPWPVEGVRVSPTGFRVTKVPKSAERALKLQGRLNES